MNNLVKNAEIRNLNEYQFIIRYTQQVAEDSWSVRYKSVNLEVPGLSDILKEGGSNYGNPHVIDVNPANSENIEPKTNTQHRQPKIPASCLECCLGEICNVHILGSSLCANVWRELRAGA